MNNSLSSPLISGLIPGIRHRERRTNNNKCLSYFQKLMNNNLTDKKIEETMLQSSVSPPERLIIEMKKLKYSDTVLSKITNLISFQASNPTQRNIPLMMLIMKQLF